MTLLLDDEQRMLRDSAQQFLATRSPVSALRALRDRGDERGYDPEIWREMADLGWPAAVLPAEFGGLGVGYKGLGAVFEQVGRTLAATPLLSTVVLAGGLLAEAGSASQRDLWLPKIGAGEALLALAIDEAPRHDPTQVTLRAWREAGHWRLDGQKEFVLDGHVADRLIVVARSADAPGHRNGLSLFLVDPAAAGVQIERTWLVDSRHAARVRLARVQLDDAALIGAPDLAFDALDCVLDRARACVAAELLGVITEAFGRTVSYLKERVQFDVPIGSFQALQHRAAHMFSEIELLKSVVLDACANVDANPALLPLSASLAKAKANDTFELVSNEAVQMHGGIGTTDEIDIGLFLKRSRVAMKILGDARFHRARYATLRGF